MSHPRTRSLALVLVLPVTWVLAACGLGASTPSSSPAPSLEATVAGFEALSGLTVPPAAQRVTVTSVSDPSGVPAYRVEFALPSAQVDAFCTDGDLQAPLDVDTVPDYLRERFAYDGDGAGGVTIAEGGLPDRVSVQRTVLATGTDTPTATVRVYAYEQAR